MRYIKRILFAVLLFAVPYIAQADPRLPDGLSAEEIDTLKVLGVFDAPLQTWTRQLAFANAVDDFARAGLLARCPRIRAFKADDFYFDPQLRAALDAVVDARYVGGVFPLTLANFRFHTRNALWALENISSNDKAALWDYNNTAAGRKVLQRYYAVQAIRVFEGLAVDIRTGVHLAAIPVAFKAYFQESGQLEDIKKAILKLDPVLLDEFDKIAPLDAYSSSQKAWLSSVGADLWGVSESLQTAFIETLPAQERAGLDALSNHVFFQLLTDATKAGEDAPGSALARALAQSNMGDRLKPVDSAMGDMRKPTHSASLNEKIATRFPEPPELRAATLTMRPADWVNNAHLAFCN